MSSMGTGQAAKVAMKEPVVAKCRKRDDSTRCLTSPMDAENYSFVGFCRVNIDITAFKCLMCRIADLALPDISGTCFFDGAVGLRNLATEVQ